MEYMNPHNVALVHFGSSPHPAHEAFANSINADIVPCSPLATQNGLVPKFGEGFRGLTLEYDVILAEGSRPLVAATMNKIAKDCTLIYLCADQFFYDLNFAGGESLWDRTQKRVISTIFGSVIDGIIAVSEFAAEFMRSVVGPNTPIRVVHPFIQDDRFEELGEVSPSLDSMTAVTVSSASSGDVGKYKGVDMLVEAWDLVRQDFPKASLRVVGKGHPEKYEQVEGVSVEGFVPSLSRVMSQASLYIQPSRADTYPVAVLEALRAGLPSIVTRTTGNRSEIRTIDPKLVSEPTPASLAKSIKYYLELNREEKKIRSQISARRGAQYHSDIWTTEFREQFHSIIGDIQI